MQRPSARRCHRRRPATSCTRRAGPTQRPSPPRCAIRAWYRQRMRRVTLLLLFVAACGGPQIPTHNGYKTGDKAKPWKKAKTLKWDEKLEAKAEGDLSYPDYRRAAWYVADLPQHGELDVRLEITPGENVGDDFDLPYEVLDPGNRVIAEDSDAGNLTKQKSLVDLDAGKYLIHVYLNGRTDTADYVLKA